MNDQIEMTEDQKLLARVAEKLGFVPYKSGVYPPENWMQGAHYRFKTCLICNTQMGIHKHKCPTCKKKLLSVEKLPSTDACLALLDKTKTRIQIEYWPLNKDWSIRMMPVLCWTDRVFGSDLPRAILKALLEVG